MFPNYVERDFLDCFVPSKEYPHWLTYKNTMTEEQKEVFLWCSQEDHLEEQDDYAKIFDLLKDNIQSFWD